MGWTFQDVHPIYFHMYRERIAISGGEPVTLAEAKSHAIIEHDEDDSLVTVMISAARRWCETWTHRRYVAHQFKLTFNADEVCPTVPLVVEQASRIDTVDLFEAFDEDDANTPLIENTDFRIQNNSLILDTDQFAALTFREFGAMELTYTALVNTVDFEAVREAVRLIVAHLYENRESTSIDTNLKEVPLGAKSHLADDRVFTV